MSAADVEIRWTAEQEEIAGALRLREQVFVLEQGVPADEEFDGLDDGALHLVALGDGQVLGTLRLLIAGERAKIGRVAVASSRRRQGIALRMMDLAISQARVRGCSEALLASQTYATALYEAAGFEICSDEFEEAGIAHVWMRRPLDTTA